MSESTPLSDDLSRRERQVLEIILRLGKASAREIESHLEDPPTYSAVRSILRILVEKKRLRKHTEGGRDWFVPVVPVEKARKGALQALVSRFFGNSLPDAACALLGDKKLKLTRQEADRLMQLIKAATKP